jgi:hypothetical protein
MAGLQRAKKFAKLLISLFLLIRARGKDLASTMDSYMAGSWSWLTGKLYQFIDMMITKARGNDLAVEVMMIIG